ncbi:sigma-70 family RNA polymerase sigma factor, partial [Verrucomicrobiales bacterium]|nr:sigma-70 family RNA polymerase sigma factor [Verrucomicrobiales bacterium]
ANGGRGWRVLCVMTPSDRDKHDQFIRLYVENEESLRGFVRSLVPTLEDAREVMQETAAVLWRKFDELHSLEDFRRWAFGVARFEALAFRRDRARDRHVFSEDLIAMLESEAEEAGEQSNREEEALKNCLRKLPGKQRALVESAYDKGVRIDQMAEEIGRTPMSLYKALHRIRMSLADCIEQFLQKEEQPG